MTTYVYDGDRLVTAITVREPEWTPDEVAHMIASRKNDQRGSHGHLLVESTSDEANPANSEGAYYYTAGPAPSVDWAEKARADAYERTRANLQDGETMAGFWFPVTRHERKKRADAN